MYKPCNNHREEIFSKVCSKTLDFIGFKETLKRLGVFWERAPALEVALQLLIGASLAWQLSLVALGFGVFILLPSRGSSLRLMRGAGAIAVGYILMQSHLPPLLQGPLQGKAKACILEKKEGSFFGRTFLCYKLQLKQFVASGRCYKNIFCTLRVKPKEAFLADHDVEITEATLTCTSPRHYQLKLTKASQVEPIEHSFSWAEKRYRWKQGVIRHLSEYIQDKKVLKLLSALSVGYLDHKTLGYEFARLGLQHLLTISGFHFALLTFFFASFLKPFFSKKIKILILIALLGLYVVYLGPAPSISRAWIGVLVYLVGEYFGVISTPINTLGLACIFSFLSNPLSILQVGFQLSYAATLGILIFYTAIERLLTCLLPKRPLTMLVSLPLYDKLLAAFLHFLRKGLALDIAVTLFTLPLVLFHTGSYPLASFLYNLFIPLLFVLVLFLLILGCSVAFCPPLCSMIHKGNAFYSAKVLHCIAAAPGAFEKTLHLPQGSYEGCLLCLILVFLGGLRFSLIDSAVDKACAAKTVDIVKVPL